MYEEINLTFNFMILVVKLFYKDECLKACGWKVVLLNEWPTSSIWS